MFKRPAEAVNLPDEQDVELALACVGQAQFVLADFQQRLDALDLLPVHEMNTVPCIGVSEVMLVKDFRQRPLIMPVLAAERTASRRQSVGRCR
jgi:hypothetical protein